MLMMVMAMVMVMVMIYFVLCFINNYCYQLKLLCAPNIQPWCSDGKEIIQQWLFKSFMFAAPSN